MYSDSRTESPGLKLRGASINPNTIRASQKKPYGVVHYRTSCYICERYSLLRLPIRLALVTLSA